MSSLFISFLVFFVLVFLFLQYASILIMFFEDGDRRRLVKNFESKKEFFIFCIPFYWFYWIVRFICNRFIKVWKEMPNE